MTAARILDVTPTEYHKLPGFSCSLARTTVSKCAAVAWDAHQRHLEQVATEDDESEDGSDDGAAGDEPKVSPDKQKRLDRGDILHALVLGVGKRIEVIPASKLGKNGAYSTKDAKALRDEARSLGRIPVKEPDMEMYQRTATAVSARLEAAGHWLDGTSELAIEWHESTPHGEVQCRAMLDHVVVTGSPPTAAFIYDLKFPGDASPDRSERTAENLGYAIPAHVYPRALNALYPSLAGRIEFRFLFCEPFRPYEFWDPKPTGMFLKLGEARWTRALLAWARGKATGRWDGYRDANRNEIDATLWALKQEGFTPEEM